MEWVPIYSDCIERAAYSGGTLLLLFAKGSKVYQYDGVPLEVWMDFLAAPSKGIFYHLHIKGKYRA